MIKSDSSFRKKKSRKLFDNEPTFHFVEEIFINKFSGGFIKSSTFISNSSWIYIILFSYESTTAKLVGL